MNDDVIEVLLEEWKAQRALLDQYRLASYKIITVVIALGSGLLIYGQQGKGYIGLAVTFGVIMLGCWLAFIQHDLDFSGIRCVELEARINAKLEITNAEGMNWTIVALNAAMGAPGFRWYVIISCALGALLFFAGLLQGCLWLWIEAEPWMALSSAAILLTLIVILAVNMCRVHQYYKDKKDDLLKSLKCSSEEN